MIWTDALHLACYLTVLQGALVEQTAQRIKLATQLSAQTAELAAWRLIAGSGKELGN